ncbi:MAG: SRPBCC family protein [Candidatus Rokubacteria bacterium]|nr:SRPBCC family protein [Candidatus Rokubacteria bacterium]
MNGLSRAIGASAVGATLMYLFDPERGRRRRAVMRDKAVSASHELGHASSVTARDVTNRTRGQVARLRSIVTRRPPSDHEIRERIRAHLGYLVRHPRSIDVRVQDGRVSLAGPILADEVDGLLLAAAAVRGVSSIDNRLEVHREPGSVPGLQGAAARPRMRNVVPWMQTYWSPTARLLAGAGGAAMAASALRSGGVMGTALGLGGVALLLRGITNMQLKHLTGIGGGRRAVTIQKAVNVQAPVERVFDFWSHYENFPQFMSHVREVRHTGEGRSHWTVSGPAGLPIEWDTEVTALVPNQVLGWRTVPGSLVEHAGIVRFDANQQGGTRVQVRMSYTPPAGALGHAVAALFRGDPKREMDEDLVRFKSLIEQGKTTADSHRVYRDELAG